MTNINYVLDKLNNTVHYEKAGTLLCSEGWSTFPVVPYKVARKAKACNHCVLKSHVRT